MMTLTNALTVGAVFILRRTRPDRPPPLSLCGVSVAAGDLHHRRHRALVTSTLLHAAAANRSSA